MALAVRKKEGFDNALDAPKLTFFLIFWSLLTNEQIILKPLDNSF